MDKFSYLNSLSINQIHELYIKYKTDSASIDPSWCRFFEGFEFAQTNFNNTQDVLTVKEFKVINLINAYRERGHLFTQTNPVRSRRQYTPTLDIENFGLELQDLETDFEAAKEIGLPKTKLKEIIQYLKDTYCRSFAIEFMYIRDPNKVKWLKDKMEPTKNTSSFSFEEKKHIYKSLFKAVSFEKFIHKRFPGQKRFSLEGAESLIPALDAIIIKGSDNGVGEFIIGMAHRGRLNVLANILKKPYSNIFSEFTGKEYEDETLLGDVKYHLGYTHESIAKNGKTIKISLCPNPSHLEAVNGVVEGLTRAKIDIDYAGDNSLIIPILIHGDAAIAAQGIVYETLQMSGLKGYKTGGTIHLIINNQIGFTTNYLDARSSTYCTDVAKTIQSPIIHVNGDDVDAVIYAVFLAIEYRQTFKNDVFIDLLCYRKYGHNEGDEPRFTQPLLYKAIENHLNPADLYLKKLMEENLDTEFVKEIESATLDSYESSYLTSKEFGKGFIANFLEKRWKSFDYSLNKDMPVTTGVHIEVLKKLSAKICTPPEEKLLFHKSIKLLQSREKMVFEDNKLDWGMVENLCYATLLNDGFSVRLSGQDCERGTFSHRHAVFTIDNSEEKFIPLALLNTPACNFSIYNSLLSEYGVLGFEYGYAMGSPDTLTIWEAQFGDFSNVAQVIFDQFIFTAEEKWRLMNGLVLFLPHGYEGQGPEHSSAKMERVLNYCFEKNIQVANLSRPANLFHILRRQMLRKFRKPLIIFTPKSLLRHSACTSTIEELSEGKFEPVIYDKKVNSDEVKKIVFCSGKIYYELEEHRAKINDKSSTVVAIEQLYPFPYDKIDIILSFFSNATVFLWVQEEPENMGAWPFIMQKMSGIKLRLISRPPSASPATGSSKFHFLQQEKIVTKTFEGCDCDKVCEQCRMLCVSKEMKSYYL
ncbi:MAG: 2-oxoglutarate dehydrogenase E1 component [Bacteroidales bacterium]|nr:2-oxoglutarate dehydrogenase E1 component [Bacteroidales bacterium]